MRGTTTYKYNHDNIHETIIEHYKYLTDLKNEVIEMLESDLNEIEKEELKELKYRTLQFEAACKEISEDDFIDQLENQETDFFFLIDGEKDEMEEIKKLELSLKLKYF